MDRFQPFSPLHALVVVTFAAVTIACIVMGRRAGDSRARRAVERIVGFAALPLFAAINRDLWLRTDEFTWARSLPLHLCDLTLLLIPAALALNWRPARVILYYFGLGLSTQGFFTPDLHEGPAHWPFWSFWMLHFMVVGTSIYDLAARGLRPTWRDLRFAITVAVLYVSVLLPIDFRLGWNYGYVGPTKPDHPTLIDVLGPWPWRVAAMTAIGIAVFTLMTLPWTLSRRPPSARTDETLDPPR